MNSKAERDGFRWLPGVLFQSQICQIQIYETYMYEIRVADVLHICGLVPHMHVQTSIQSQVYTLIHNTRYRFTNSSLINYLFSFIILGIFFFFEQYEYSIVHIFVNQFSTLSTVLPVSFLFFLFRKKRKFKCSKAWFSCPNHSFL